MTKLLGSEMNHDTPSQCEDKTLQTKQRIQHRWWERKVRDTYFSGDSEALPGGWAGDEPSGSVRS